MSDLKQFFENKRQTMIDRLTAAVNHESFSSDKAAVDGCGRYFADQFAALGADVAIFPRETVGDIVYATWNGDAPGKPLVILTHMDTVHPVGSFGEHPARLDEEGRLHGPGALDMKGGIVVALTAIEGLIEMGQMPNRPVSFMVTSDEEIGSLQSRELIEEKGKESALALVLEPPNADGSIKTWRKGVSSFRLEIEGKAAHAGNEPEKGINAVIEFAQQAMEIHALNDYKNGTSVSVTRVEGGTATNVIPAKTVAYIDTRVMSVKVYEQIYEKLMARAPFVPGSKVTMTRLHYRPPMERNGAVFEQAQRIAEAAGIALREGGAGGGSDGNFTAALGIPTLDGLGPEGSGLHAPHEHVRVNTMPSKAAFVAAVLRDWKD